MSELGRVPDSTVFLLYGATGDLARRMVLPAFFRLAQNGCCPTTGG
jgi:glucose-6-phosphate 1-dehydrogenase